jgi:hypothetical protein
MLVLAASSHRGACFADDGLNGFVLAELMPDGLLPGQFGRVEELYARDGDAELERALIQAAVDWLWQHEVFVIRTELDLGESAEVVESLGFQAETTRFGLYRESSTSNCTSSP